MTKGLVTIRKRVNMKATIYNKYKEYRNLTNNLIRKI